ncbi:MAG: hypothetical protein M0R28_20275 [Pigmentiphaga sp.]|nr:hypothetical protein [Pigmentiphaga sp.]
MPETYEQRAARLRRWRHTSFLGGVEMARQTMRAIETTPSATPEAKQLASELHQKLEELRGLLRKRVD